MQSDINITPQETEHIIAAIESLNNYIRFDKEYDLDKLLKYLNANNVLMNKLNMKLEDYHKTKK